MRGPRFKLLRTRAMLLLAQVSLKRGKELGQTKTSAILRLPDGGGLLLNYVWGKTLREGSKHVFGVLRKSDVVLCPVAALEEYVAGAKAMDITLSGHGRFLFPPWAGVARGRCRQHSPFVRTIDDGPAVLVAEVWSVSR